MEKEEIDNNCFACAYCVKHYYNLNGRFQLTNCMHCINDNINWQAKKKLITNKVKCEYWTPEKIQVEQRRESIEKYLRSTAKNLQEIAQILKEDSKINK